MNVKIYNTERLDCNGSQVKICIPICHGEESGLVLTKNKANEMGNNVLSKLRKLNRKGFFILKIVRIMNGITQAEMAKLLSMPASTYRHKENRYYGSGFMLTEVSTICKKFNMSADLLFRQDDVIKIA